MRIALLALTFLGAMAVFHPGAPRQASVVSAQDGATIVVTTASDEAGACPGDTCTLRAAIDATNVDEGDLDITIGFDPAIFDAEDPATIFPLSPLPAIARPRTTVDATGLGVVLDGSSLPSEGPDDGLAFAAEGARVAGIAIYGFSGACLRVGGADAVVGGSASTQGLRLGNCETGIVLEGEGASVMGVAIGFAPDEIEAAPVATGIVVTAGDSTIGDADLPGPSNVIGNASVGIMVGDGTPPPFNGVTISGNRIGTSADGAAALVGIGVQLRHRSAVTQIERNQVANAAIAGIQVVGDDDGFSVIENPFRLNTFEDMGGMAIDLGADGVLNPNDEGDGDTGPNNLVNHPLITRAVQARIDGVACPLCEVQLYRAVHMPGDGPDYGTTLLPGGVIVAGPGGEFTMLAPPLAPGDWVIAVLTDAAGNTSEFGPAARVGAGAIQCGNLGLHPGWNHGGFFGASSVILGDTFPSDPGGHVRAIYHLGDGTGAYTHWFRDTPIGRTLTSLEPGEAYWFLADGPLVIPGGFQLTEPLPVPIAEGLNEFVYFGATGDLADALGSLGGDWGALFRWTNDGNGPGRWTAAGDAATPPWAREFGAATACAAYAMNASEAGTLTPLQP